VPQEQVTWSEETYRIFGVDRASFVPSFDAVLARTHPDDRDHVGQRRRDVLAGLGDYAIDHRIMLDDGAVRHVHERGRLFPGAEGRSLRAVGTVQDITERKRTEETLLFANTLLKTEMETSPDAIIVVDERGRIRSHNRRFAQMWDVPIEVLESGEGASVMAAVTARVTDPEGFRDRVAHLYRYPEEEGHDEIETIDGRFIDRHTASLRLPSGRFLGRVWYFRDITDRKRAEAEIRHSATHDALTGLANRAVFKVAVGQAMARARRYGTSVALLSLDLDHFKDVNDTQGHQGGDELMRQVAIRLRASCRATDMIARFGGDEFAVVASDLVDPAEAAILARALIAAVSEPFQVQGNEVRTGASVGIATYTDGQGDAETLLSHADVALYRAKAEGRETYRFFTDAMDQELRMRVLLGGQLRTAIQSGELFLLYQPQVNVRTGRITGVEALVRWRHPDRGLLEPALFIPIAERSGLIALLSQWVLRESCRQARAWLDAGLELDRLAVNLSALQFKAPFELERDVVSTLEATGLSPHHLELEITETALMVASRDSEEADVLSRLRGRGVRLTIDDFGIGYSSLDYLRTFPVDRIKIPRAFVAQIEEVGGSTAIVKATIGLARELGIAVIAEGVESEHQLRLLGSWGCEGAQGFFISPPRTAEGLTAMLGRDGLVPMLAGDSPPSPARPDA
jgi:diguanylate cyclase (GGDEF)-like protein/PAS domain S-box-containing protein